MASVGALARGGPGSGHVFAGPRSFARAGRAHLAVQGFTVVCNASTPRNAVCAPLDRTGARGVAIAAAIAATLLAAPLRAGDPVPPPAGAPAGETPAPPSDAPKPAPAEGKPNEPDRSDELRALSRPIGRSARIFGTLAFGKGIRFNNPYRLSAQLGSTPESASLTASYVDLGLAFALGPPDGLQHGAALHFSAALHGVPQTVLTPTYLLAYRGPHRWLAYGRLGPSFVLSPDVTFGGEVAGGFGFFITSRIAVSSELVFDVYYGAGTHDVGVATYPILSGQLGLLFDYEVLP